MRWFYFVCLSIAMPIFILGLVSYFGISTYIAGLIGFIGFVGIQLTLFKNMHFLQKFFVAKAIAPKYWKNANSSSTLHTIRTMFSAALWMPAVFLFLVLVVIFFD